MVTINQFALVVVVSKHKKSRYSKITCFVFFDNGDEFIKFLIECPARILSFRQRLTENLEDSYYTSPQVAKISDCCFITLKYVMDNLGISSFLTERSNGFLNLISLTTGILVFGTLAYQRPDFTLLTRLFFISSPQLYSTITALNACLYWELVKKSIDFSATTLNVLVGIWAPDFFSRNQAWLIGERVLREAKVIAQIAIISAIECSDEARHHLKVHKKLLKPLESYFNPSEVESMNLVPNEFSHSDMVLLEDKLNEFDEFSEFKGSLSIQTMMFLVACKGIKSSCKDTTNNENSETAHSETESANIKLKFCKQMFRGLAYRSSTLRPLARLSGLLTSSRHCVKFVKNSHNKRMLDKQKRNILHLEKCLQSKSLK